MGSEAVKQHDVSRITAPVVLSVVNIEQSISKWVTVIGESRNLDILLDELLKKCMCTTPSQMTFTTKYTKEAIESVRKSIMRYKMEPDRWIALSSVLLKSMAFHQSNQVYDDDTNKRLFQEHSLLQKKLHMRPIVELPRTKYNRPYIPCLSKNQLQEATKIAKCEGDGENENPAAKISVSHQYPYVAIVQSSSPFRIGIDIVVFYFQKNELTPTIEGFLQLFQASFTPWEWEKIHYNQHDGISRRHRCDDAKLREFFLRWAMKEAYTKALGLGMHVEFSSFETKLISIDVSEHSQIDDSIWSRVLSDANEQTTFDTSRTKCFDSTTEQSLESQRQYSVLGEVRKVQSTVINVPPHSNIIDGVWEFVFVPFSIDKGVSHHACCCICRETLPQTGITSRLEDKTSVIIKNVDLLDVIKMHEKE